MTAYPALVGPSSADINTMQLAQIRSVLFTQEKTRETSKISEDMMASTSSLSMKRSRNNKDLRVSAWYPERSTRACLQRMMALTLSKEGALCAFLEQTTAHPKGSLSPPEVCHDTRVNGKRSPSSIAFADEGATIQNMVITVDCLANVVHPPR